MIVYSKLPFGETLCLAETSQLILYVGYTFFKLGGSLDQTFVIFVIIVTIYINYLFCFSDDIVAYTSSSWFLLVYFTHDSITIHVYFILTFFIYINVTNIHCTN